MRIRTGLLLSALLVTPVPALASEGTVSVELPRVSARTYRKPYVAVWIEASDGRQVRVLRVFHDQHRVGGRWLPEMRTWWRRGGRAMEMPADGVSTPTRAPGRHTIPMGSLDNLPAGQYSIAVEAVREHGGREIVKVPFSWRAGSSVNASASGSTEIGTVSVSIRP